MQLNLSDVLKQWRYGARLSVREAAERIGVNYSTLSRLENGEDPGGESIVRIVRWLLVKEKKKK